MGWTRAARSRYDLFVGVTLPLRCERCEGFIAAAEGAGEAVAWLCSPQETTHHWLHVGENLVGRAGTGIALDVPLDHGTVSRRQATLLVTDNEISVMDLGSTGGTHVNRELTPRGTWRALAHGDQIRFNGLTCFLVVVR